MYSAGFRSGNSRGSIIALVGVMDCIKIRINRGRSPLCEGAGRPIVGGALAVFHLFAGNSPLCRGNFAFLAGNYVRAGLIVNGKLLGATPGFDFEWAAGCVVGNPYALTM